MDDPDVLAKRDSAAKWCGHASEYAKTFSGKPWRYLLIPHGDAVVENMTIEALAAQFGTT
jgi:type III restriction enzyme